jgi:hypothetical protein
VPDEKLLEWAKKSAAELARKHGVPEDGIYRDTDMETTLKEEDDARRAALGL